MTWRNAGHSRKAPPQIAFTYLGEDEDTEDDQVATVVVDRSGREMRRYDYALLWPRGNAAWSPDGCLGVWEERWPGRRVEVDVRTGDERVVGRGGIGGIGDRLVVDATVWPNGPRQFNTVRNDGTDERPLIRVEDAMGMHLEFDFATQV